MFTVLAWNLFARSCSVADLRYTHLSLEGDSIVVDFSKTKSDQVGEKTTPKHIYANPYKPHICPFLALALHVFSTASVSPTQLGGGGQQGAASTNNNAHKVFPGAPYDSYSKWLIDALTMMTNLGYIATDFGTHSFRKGVVTFISGGFLGGPGVIAIFLRAGWSLGGVQDRYIHYQDGADQYLGRIVCGLNLNDSDEFCVLPPRFASEAAVGLDIWEYILPGYQHYPASFQACLPVLLASILYHWSWLTDLKEAGGSDYAHISRHHPFFQSRLYRMSDARRHELRQHVIVNAINGRCPVTGMTATGIPPTMDISRKISRVADMLELLRSETAAMKQDLVDDIINKMRDTFSVNNLEHNTITRADFQRGMDELMTTISARMQRQEEIVLASSNANRQATQVNFLLSLM